MYWSFAIDPPPVLFVTYRFKDPKSALRDDE
jgi:hypothetical protein